MRIISNPPASPINIATSFRTDKEAWGTREARGSGRARVHRTTSTSGKARIRALREAIDHVADIQSQTNVKTNRRERDAIGPALEDIYANLSLQPPTTRSGRSILGLVNARTHLQLLLEAAE